MNSPVRRIAIAILLVLSPAAGLSAQSQESPPRVNRWGIVAGLNFARFTGTDDPSTTNQKGLMAGVYALRPLAENFDFQPELLFTQKGVGFAESGATGALTMNYVEIPLLVRFNVPVTSPDMRPHVYAGPAFAVRLTCNESVSSGSFSASGSCSTNGGTTTSNSANDPKSLDAGAVVGGGVSFRLSGGRAMSVGVRYEFGLIDITPTAAASSTATRNRVLTFLASLDFAGSGTP